MKFLSLRSFNYLVNKRYAHLISNYKRLATNLCNVYLVSTVHSKPIKNSFNLLMVKNIANNNDYNRLMSTKQAFNYKNIENENLLALEVIESTFNNPLNADIETKTNSNNSVYNDMINALLECDGKALKWSIRGLSEQLDSLDVIELRNLLSFMTTCTLPNDIFEPNYYKLWSALDTELTKRFNSLSMYGSEHMQPLLLNIANLFYKLMISRVCQFSRLFISRLSAPDFQLNKQQLLHVMFHLNVMRMSDVNTMSRFDSQLIDLIDGMTIEEVFVACLAFFKTQSIFSRELTLKILKKAISEINANTNDIVISSIVKATRYSYRFEFRKLSIELINHLKHLSFANGYNLAHILQFSYKIGNYDKELIDRTLTRLKSNPHSFRLKEVERILLYACSFDHNVDHSTLDLVSDYIYSNQEVMETQFLRYLSSILQYMCIMNYYPQKLIELCFEPQFLDKLFKDPKIEFQRDLLSVNTSLSIERYPEYENILLSSHRINRLRQWVLRSEKSTLGYKTRKTRMLNSVYLSLKSEFGSKIQLTHIFPFSSYPNLIITNDEFNEANLILKPHIFDNCKSIYILFNNDYMITDENMCSEIIKGVTRLEIRLLQKLGFKVLVKPWHQFIGYRTKYSMKTHILNLLQNI